MIARRVAMYENERPDPRASDITSGYALGVAEMLAYASDPAAPVPITVSGEAS